MDGEGGKIRKRKKGGGAESQSKKTSRSPPPCQGKAHCCDFLRTSGGGGGGGGGGGWGEPGKVKVRKGRFGEAGMLGGFCLYQRKRKEGSKSSCSREERAVSRILTQLGRKRWRGGG